MRRTLPLLALCGLLAAGLAAPASAAHEQLVVTGLTQNDKLVTFEAGTGDRLSQVKLSGIAKGQTLVALDYRPATGGLYGVAVDGTRGYVYLIDDETGAAELVGGGFFLEGEVSIDVNPAADRLRIVSTSGQNLRLDVDAATFSVLPDKPLTPGYTVVGAAYTNNDDDGTTPTALYDIDAAGDRLLLQAPPNDGTLTPIGALGLDVDEATGFDVYTEGASNIALLSVRGGGTRVYTVALGTGAVNVSATSGVRVQGAPVVDIAVDPRQ